MVRKHWRNALFLVFGCMMLAGITTIIETTESTTAAPTYAYVYIVLGVVGVVALIIQYVVSGAARRDEERSPMQKKQRS